MSYYWKKCPVCHGQGNLILQKTRISFVDKGNKKTPILPDKVVKCDTCKGRGEVYTKENYLDTPFNQLGDES
jgi:DnaJ-class molecular chaperone